MKIILNKISIKDLYNGYLNNNNENGVLGYQGKLNIRPKYQREFVYKEKQQVAVINSIINNLPLNVMYWSVNSDGTYELLDGQQRTISICEYIKGNFSVNGNYFHNLQKEDSENILSYELMIYFCEGTDKEKLSWFETINIAGEKLTDQELKNAVYTGDWLSDAKKYFSKTGCPAYELGNKYIKGIANRQELLELAIKWISNDNIIDYMAKHQHDNNASELWQYFQHVINWIKIIFGNDERKEMKEVNWGELYNEYKYNNYNSTEMMDKVNKLMIDEEITKKSGIYYYVITDNEKYLNLRTFPDNIKRESYEKCSGICLSCVKNNNNKIKYEINEMDADHIIPWVKGGKTNIDNCQMLCRNCNHTKSGK